MKLPSTVFVLHCPKLNPERKAFLEPHLKDRVPIEDVRWCEDFNHDHPLVEWLNHTQKLPYGVKITSGLVKSLEIFRTMIDENIDRAIILNDDVMFHKDWLRYYESVPVPDDILFVNIGTALFLDIKPVEGKVHVIGNNGGCEGVYVTKEFAELYLTCLNLNHTADIIVHGFLSSIGHPLLCLPICYQTSIIENKTSLDHDTRADGNWIQFVNGYKDSKKVNYFKLLDQYKEYLKLKKSKEDKIFELYGKRVDLRNIDYVYGHPAHFCNTIIA
jgi:hypothetical protein